MIAALAILHWLPPLAVFFAARALLEQDADTDSLHQIRRFASRCWWLGAVAWGVALAGDALWWTSLGTVQRLHNGVLIVVGLCCIAGCLYLRLGHRRASDLGRDDLHERQ